MSKIIPFGVEKEDQSISSLLNEARIVLLNILMLDEGTRYPVTITDDNGTIKTTESALECAKSLVVIALENYLDQAQETLSNEK